MPDDLHPLDPARIPPAIRAGLARYANAGIRPGDCMYAVLAGDLFAAWARADPDTWEAMPAILTFIINDLGAPCGDYLVVDRWIANHAAALSREGSPR